MTIRNLAGTLRPESVAVIGASTREGSVGRIVIENVLKGGFAGAIYPINPKYDTVAGLRCYGRIADLPETPDLAVVATPAETVPAIVRELGERGVPVAAILASGFDRRGLRQKLLDAARPRLVRIIGPDTIGLMAPQVRLNASFSHIPAEPGRLGLISQSSAIVSSVIDWAAAEHIGFSQVFALGEMADVDAADCLNLLAEDSRTAAILLYLESVPAPRKFMSAARAAAQLKPVIAVKPGRHGRAAGSDRVVDAALRRAGVIRVNDLDDLFSAAEITARFQPLDRGRTAIITNGVGVGVLAVDHLIDLGCELAVLDARTIATLDGSLPPNWSHANPVDILGDAPPERYRAAIAAVAADPGVDALLVMNCPTGLASSSGVAEAVADMAVEGLVHGKPVLACWLGKETAEAARSLLQESGIASVDTPKAAADAVALLTRWSALRRLIERVPANTAQFRTDRVAVTAIFQSAAREGRALLTGDEAKAVLGAYGVPARDGEPGPRRPEAQELVAGLRVDPTFGPTVLFGAGGMAMDVLDDTAIGLVPLDEVLAGDLFARTRISKLLAGYDGVPPVDREAIEQALIGLSQLAIDFPCIVGADINPLLADAEGVVALAARVEIDPARVGEKGPGKNLAIRPYPSGWDLRARVGERAFLVRPMRPADIGLYPQFTARMSPEDMRMRFLAPTRDLSQEMLINFTQLDYDRDIAFIAIEEPDGGMAGVVRYSADPDHERAEFGITVRSDLKGVGLGKILLGRLIAYARADGIRTLDGVVLRENTAMLHLASRFGFRPDAGPADSSVVRTTLALDQVDPVVQ